MKKNTLSIFSTVILITTLLLINSCSKEYIKPTLKSLVNTESKSLSFDNTKGNIQNIDVKVTRAFHGTGPFGPRQEYFSIEYSMSVNGDGFMLEVDGGGIPSGQVIDFRFPEKQQGGTYTYDTTSGGLYIYPLHSDNMEYVYEETQLTLNGKTYNHVIRFCSSRTCENLSNNSLDSPKIIFLAEGYGLVAFETFKADTFYLTN